MKKGNLFWGLLFILAGVFLIVSKLGYFEDVGIFRILLSIGLAAIALKSIFRLNFASALFPIAFICIINKELLGIENISSWTILLAALLASIGFSLLFPKRNKWVTFNYSTTHSSPKKIDVEDESYIRNSTTFGSSIKYVNTEQFIEGDIECSFGAMKLYFDNTKMKNESATLKIDASFSGIELYIPKKWKVVDQTKSFAGGIEEKNKPYIETTHTLTLVGDLSFSGVQVIYV